MAIQKAGQKELEKADLKAILKAGQMATQKAGQMELEKADPKAGQMET